MPEEQIEQLKEALRTILGMVSQRGQPINEDLRALLTQVVEHVGERIQEIRSAGVPENKLRMARPFPSAQVHSFDYDPRNQNLYVKFQDKWPGQNGPVYQYGNVPQSVFALLARGGVAPTTTGKNRWHAWKKGVTPSLGAVMAHVVKAGGYPYQRLT